MRKRICFLILALVSSLAYTVNAQQQTTPKPSLNAIYNMEVTADEMTHDAATKVATYSKNVTLKLDHLKLENTGKVVFDMKTRKFTIYDCKKFAFEGNCVVKENAAKTNTLEYTLGDDILYLL